MGLVAAGAAAACDAAFALSILGPAAAAGAARAAGGGAFGNLGAAGAFGMRGSVSEVICVLQPPPVMAVVVIPLKNHYPTLDDLLLLRMYAMFSYD